MGNLTVSSLGITKMACAVTCAAGPGKLISLWCFWASEPPWDSCHWVMDGWIHDATVPPGGVRIKEMRPKNGPTSSRWPTSLHPAGGSSNKGPCLGPHSGNLKASTLGGLFWMQLSLNDFIPSNYCTSNSCSQLQSIRKIWHHETHICIYMYILFILGNNVQVKRHTQTDCSKMRIRTTRHEMYNLVWGFSSRSCQRKAAMSTSPMTW